MDKFIATSSQPPQSGGANQVIEQPSRGPELVIDLTQPILTTELTLIALLALWKFVVEPFKEKVYRRLSYSLEDETKISLLLAQIMAVSKADRVTLLEFHNGEISRGGRHLNKLSPTKEVVGPGLAKVRSLQGTILVNVISGVVEKLQSTPLLKTEVGALSDGHCKNSFLAIGTHYAATTLLKDSEGPIAVMMIEYQEQDPDKFNELEFKAISKHVSELIYILTKSKRQWLEALRELIKGK